MEKVKGIRKNRREYSFCYWISRTQPEFVGSFRNLVNSKGIWNDENNDNHKKHRKRLKNKWKLEVKVKWSKMANEEKITRMVVETPLVITKNRICI